MFVPIQPIRVRNSYARRDRFIDYLLWIKTLPCLVALEALTSPWLMPEPCNGVIQADHVRSGGSATTLSASRFAGSTTTVGLDVVVPSQ